MRQIGALPLTVPTRLGVLAELDAFPLAERSEHVRADRDGVRACVRHRVSSTSSHRLITRIPLPYRQSVVVSCVERGGWAAAERGGQPPPTRERRPLRDGMRNGSPLALWK